MPHVKTPWYADVADYLAIKAIPPHWFTLDKGKFFWNVRNFFWDDPYLLKYCLDQLICRCVPDDEILSVITFCHT